uniref:Uncharacterized protein n=1 Tax=Rhizophora mucronata TaxID=61149 RepID=A0A2P2PSF9_RHIMU
MCRFGGAYFIFCLG